MLSARRAVQQLQEYHPPLASREGLRLDFNENTSGCSPRVLERLKEITADDLARYPERGPAQKIVAEHLGLAPEQILLTNGVDEAIHLLCEAYLDPQDEVLVVTPTFSMFEIYTAATGARVIDLEHAEGRGDYQHFILRIEIGLAQQVDGFVHAVGQQYLLRRKSKMLGDNLLRRPALGIAGKIISRDFLQPRQHARRTSAGVLVEVETQALTARQRGMILLQLLHGSSGAKHGRTSRGPTRHGSEGLQFQRGL